MYMEVILSFKFNIFWILWVIVYKYLNSQDDEFQMTRCWIDLTVTERSLSPSAKPHRYHPPDLNETELEPNKCQQMSTKGNKCPQMVANVNRRSALQVLHNYEAKRKREHLELQLSDSFFKDQSWQLCTSCWKQQSSSLKKIKSWKAQSASTATALIHLSWDRSSSLDRLQ